MLERCPCDKKKSAKRGKSWWIRAESVVPVTALSDNAL